MVKQHGQSPLTRKRTKEFLRKQKHSEKLKEHLLRGQITKALRKQHFADLNDYRIRFVKELEQYERWREELYPNSRLARGMGKRIILLKKRLKHIDEWAKQAKENPE